MEKDTYYKTECNHVFHKECLKNWIQINNKNLNCHECYLLRRCFNTINNNKNIHNCYINYGCPLCRQKNNIDIKKKDVLLTLDEIENRINFNKINNIEIFSIPILGLKYDIL
tara:strand:- start:278 stop:613 length:336 start_codon:yes stop_codon:yes gene_type:complete